MGSDSATPRAPPGAPAEPAPNPAPPGFPRRFGSYLLLSPIAQGGMGDVFLASTLGVGGAVRLVVIKTLREDLTMEPGYLNRFLDEARIVIQLQHPNISQVFDVGLIDGTHYMAMEHILGTNLRRLTGILARDKARLPEALALHIVAEVLEGLDCAHKHRHALTDQPLQVVHRDVSPQNVMLSLQGEVKIIDFGLAESALKLEQTETAVVLGKIAYMSPEHARGAPVDARADQFSAAVVLYELLTGARFYGERPQGEIWAIAGRGILPDRMQDLDPEIGAVLMRALSPNSEHRFASCGELAAELRTILAARSPETDRAALRDFMRSAASLEVETSEKNVRALSQLALQSVPDIATPRGAADSELPTSVTKASLAPADPIAVTRAVRRPLIAAAIGAVVLIGAVASFVILNEPTPVDAQPIAQSIGQPAPPPPAPVVPLPPASADAGVIAEAEQPREADRLTRRAPRREKPTWLKWSLDRKIKALTACDQSCARLVRKLHNEGKPLLAPMVDSCLVQCKVR